MKKILIIITIILAIVAAISITMFLINNNNEQKSESVIANIEAFSENDENIINNALDIENNDVVEEESEETEEVDEEKSSTQNVNTSYNGKYYIKVNYQANCVTIYVQDENGNFTKPVKAMVCSTGTATPRGGVYGISDKYVWGWLIGGVYGHYSTRITGSILFHSVPYTAYGDNGSLEYWEYDKLGTTASAGCVRLAIADAKWIYDNCAWGTQVEFYADSNPGPLGKPNARKISDEDESVRGWDPTDPNPNNPWNTYKKETAKVEEVKSESVKKEEIKVEEPKIEEVKAETKKDVVNKDNTKMENEINTNNNIINTNTTQNVITNTVNNLTVNAVTNIVQNIINNNI